MQVFCQWRNEKQEKRLMTEINHCISKTIVNFAVENGVSQ
jgi:hypothetical protein